MDKGKSEEIIEKGEATRLWRNQQIYLLDINLLKLLTD